jgi:flagellar hook-length control protein FliK
MSPSASQPLSTAPGLEPTPERREPLPSGGAPPGAPPEGPPFHSALATEWARTAIAEGQQQSRSQHPGHRAADTPSGTKPTAGLVPSVPTTPAGSTITPAAAPGRTAPDEPPPSATAGNDVNQGPAARPSSPTSSVGGELVIQRDGTPTAGPALPKDDTPPASAPATPKEEASTGSGIASAPREIPQNAPAAGASVQVHSTPKVPPTGDLPIPHSSAAPATTRYAGDLAKTPSASMPSPSTNVNGGPGTSGLSASTASPLTPTAAESNPAAPAGELVADGYGVGLQEAIESLHGTIQLTARQGLTQARISLQPEELGEIRINLTQTVQGLLARVTAESPAAAQALAAAHAQLRQSLSSLGVNLTRLDIGHHDLAHGGGADAKGDGQSGAARGEGFAGGRPGRSTAIVAPADPETETDTPAVEEPALATAAPANGTLIDVLA